MAWVSSAEAQTPGAWERPRVAIAGTLMPGTVTTLGGERSSRMFDLSFSYPILSWLAVRAEVGALLVSGSNTGSSYFGGAGLDVCAPFYGPRSFTGLGATSDTGAALCVFGGAEYAPYAKLDGVQVTQVLIAGAGVFRVNHGGFFADLGLRLAAPISGPKALNGMGLHAGIGWAF